MDEAKLLKDLESCEGWKSTVYKDTLGVWTIGFGFNVDPDHHGDLPLTVGRYWLNLVATQRWEALQGAAPWIASQPEPIQRALANMSYQLGIEGLMQFKHMLSALKNHDIDKAITEAMDSRWARQTPHRAQFIVNLFRSAK